MFRFFSCKFRIQKSKEKTARVVLWREFNIMNCFTLEASFHGYFDKERETKGANCLIFWFEIPSSTIWTTLCILYSNTEFQVKVISYWQQISSRLQTLVEIKKIFLEPRPRLRFFQYSFIHWCKGDVLQF